MALSAPVAPPLQHALADKTLIENKQSVTISERRTDELVIGFVGAIGSGATTTAQALADILEREYGYSTNYIKVSSLILEMSALVGEPLPSDDDPVHARITRMQDIGNKLRRRYSNSYLAEKCVERIAVDRLNPPLGIESGYAEQAQEETAQMRLPINRRRLHIIDAIKHTAEVELLREVYGNTFWLFGVFAPEEAREARLRRLKFETAQLSKLFQIDEEDGLDYGQKVRETVYQADFFVRNDGLNEDRLKLVLGRYVRILFNVNINTPTLDETAMYNAASQASTSACLSRQVGAAIFSKAGELIGVGANDVPKASGGLYCSEDGEQDHRCFKQTNGICRNDEHKELLYSAIFKELRTDKVLADTVTQAGVTKALRRTDIRNLIEYSRAVHAEMEAIISVARGNKPGLNGATLYCTTFPCHSCARHIVASGIMRVFYIEPYAKSLALELHGDAIVMKDSGESKKVAFLQYEGVAPRNMIRLFKHGIKRKAGGKMIKIDPRSASPIFPSPLDGFAFREQLVVDNLLKNEQNAVNEVDRGKLTDGKGSREVQPTQLTLVDTIPEAK
jgi:deoxycytidylate deaminase